MGLPETSNLPCATAPGALAFRRPARLALALTRVGAPTDDYPAPAVQAALRKELCKHHPDLVKALAPLGAKLRMQDVLPRQPANPDDRDPDPHPEPRVTRGQGQGGSADEDSWEQLYAEASRGSGESEAAAAGAEAQEGLGAGQEAAGAEDAFRLLPEFFVLGKTAKGEPVVRLDRAAMLRWWRLRAGGHRDSGRATSSRDVGAAAAMEPPAPVQGPARAPVVQELEAMAAQTAACAAGASDQPCSAAVHQPAGRGADEDHVLERTGQERVDAGVGGGGDNEAPVAWDAAGDPGSRPEADGGPGGHLSTAAATNMMQVDAPQGVGVPGTSLSTPVVASVECGHSSGGASDGGNAVGSAAAIGDGPVHLEGGGGEAAPAGAAPADAASADLPRGTPFPASGAAGPAAHLAPHLPSLATLPTPPHAELHGQPPGPTAASDHGLPPPPAGQTTRNALPAIHIEKISQLKQAALKIGSHAPADDILAAVAAAVPGKDQAAMLRRRCALMLLARGSEESQGPYGPYSMAAVGADSPEDKATRVVSPVSVRSRPEQCHACQQLSNLPGLLGRSAFQHLITSASAHASPNHGQLTILQEPLADTPFLRFWSMFCPLPGYPRLRDALRLPRYVPRARVRDRRQRPASGQDAA